MTGEGRALMAGFVLAAGALTGPAAAESDMPPVRTLASHPAGTFLENMLVEADGSVLYTSYFDHTIRLHRPDGSNTTFATLKAHPISLARRGSDVWVIAQSASFADGPAFMASNQLMRVDGEGRTTLTVPAPDARFLNGNTDLPGGDLLIADSVAGVIWRFSPDTLALTVWLRDPLLLQVAGANGALPGANGVKLTGRRLLVSNTSRGEILEAAVGRDGRPGRLRTLSRTGPIDDFHVDTDGTIIAATHVSSVIRVCRDGRVAKILSRGVDGATATAAAPGRNAIYVLTTGTPLGGAAGPAGLIEVELPAPTKPCGG